MELVNGVTRVLDIHADKRRRKIFLRHDLHRLERLVGVARPPLRGFTPPFEPVFNFYADDQRAAVLEKSRRAAIDLPHRQH